MSNFYLKLRQFMTGRYGADKFNSFLVIAAIVLMVLSWFTVPGFYMLSLLLVAYAVFRMLSRNVTKRSYENVKYMYYHDKVKGKISKYKTMWSQRKTHKFFKCPSCRQQVRVPKGRGTIQITCPKCRTVFNKTT